MSSKVKYQFPDSYCITLEDYANVVNHAAMANHLPLFYSQLGNFDHWDTIIQWYHKEVYEASRARLPPFDKDPDIWGVKDVVHRPGIVVNRGAFSYAKTSAEADAQRADFRAYYEPICRSKNGETWNLESTLGMRVSQVYAMNATGPVAILFSRPDLDGSNMSIDTAWGGCEFPCLTRNKSIKKIYQVDPYQPLLNEQGRLNPRCIWSRDDGDGPTKHGPRGHLYAFGKKYEDRVYEECPLLDRVLEERGQRKRKSNLTYGARLAFQLSRLQL